MNQLNDQEKNLIAATIEDQNNFVGKAFYVTHFDHILSEDEAKELIGSYGVYKSYKDKGHLARYMKGEKIFKNFLLNCFQEFSIYHCSTHQEYRQIDSEPFYWKLCRENLREEKQHWLYFQEAGSLIVGTFDCCMVLLQLTDLNSPSLVRLFEIGKTGGLHFFEQTLNTANS